MYVASFFALLDVASCVVVASLLAMHDVSSSCVDIWWLADCFIMMLTVFLKVAVSFDNIYSYYIHVYEK